MPPSPSTPLDALRARWDAYGARLRAGALHRVPFAPAPGAPWLDFASNDYLGLRSDERLVRAGVDNVTHSGGAGAGASRLVVQLDAGLSAMEARFAQWVGSEDGVFLGSGFTANCALLDGLAAVHTEPGEFEVFLDHRAHASLFAAARLCGKPVYSFRHGDMENLAEKLGRSQARFKLVIVESLHSMDGTFEDARRLAETCLDFGALLCVDEAHTAGIIGPRGAGWCELHRDLLGPVLVATMYGCGKAVGVSGGFIAGSAALKDVLFQRARALLYTTGVSPFITGAVDAAIGILDSAEGDDLRAWLQKNISVFRSCLEARDVSFGILGADGATASPLFSIPMKSDAAAISLQEALGRQGLGVRAIRPPTVPRGTTRMRVVVKAAHGEGDLARLAQALAEGMA